jgi:2-succinyl-6-hydroxy-2,4-cyclohexadiene-1-carboxylate synthase
LETGLVFIHGFLGGPQDWKQVVSHVPHKACYFVDLNRDFEIADLNFQAWPKAFKNWMKQQKISVPLSAAGYSMGGRLALELLDQGLVQAATVVSSHVGFPEMAFKERTERRLQNQKWSEKFLQDDWQSLLREWNAQEVFAGSAHEPVREEKDFIRQKLAAMLTGFSISEQKDYSYLLKSKKLHFLVGNRDKKYGMLALKLMRDFPEAGIEIIQDAGHRLIFDQPQSVAAKI